MRAFAQGTSIDFDDWKPGEPNNSVYQFAGMTEQETVTVSHKPQSNPHHNLVARNVYEGLLVITGIQPVVHAL